MPEPDLGISAGLEQEEVEDMDEDELREAIVDELGEARLGSKGDGFPRVAEASSLLGLL